MIALELHGADLLSNVLSVAGRKFASLESRIASLCV